MLSALTSLPTWQYVIVLLAFSTPSIWLFVKMVRDNVSNAGFYHEEIACVAIKYHDLHGVVMTLPAPARHHHVMWARHFVDGMKTGDNGIQGFLTTNGRFVDRAQALKIAAKRGQIVKKHPWEGELYSEDLWPDTPKEARGWTIAHVGDRSECFPVDHP